MSLENKDVESDTKKMSLDTQKIVIPCKKLGVRYVWLFDVHAIACPLVPHTTISYRLFSRWNERGTFRGKLVPYHGPEWVDEDQNPIKIMGQWVTELEICDVFGSERVFPEEKVIVTETPLFLRSDSTNISLGDAYVGKDVIDQLETIFFGEKIMFTRRRVPKEMSFDERISGRENFMFPKRCVPTEMSLDQQKIVIPCKKLSGGYLMWFGVHVIACPLVPHTTISYKMFSLFIWVDLTIRLKLEPYDGPEWVDEDQNPIEIMGQVVIDLKIKDGFEREEGVVPKTKIIITKRPLLSEKPLLHIQSSRPFSLGDAIVGKDVIDQLETIFAGKNVMFPKRCVPKEMSFDERKVVIPVSKIDKSVAVEALLYDVRFSVVVCPLVPHSIIPYRSFRYFSCSYFLGRDLSKTYEGPEWVDEDQNPIEIMGQFDDNLSFKDSFNRKAVVPEVRIIITKKNLLPRLLPHYLQEDMIFGKDLIDQLGITFDGEKVLLPEIFKMEGNCGCSCKVCQSCKSFRTEHRAESDLCTCSCGSCKPCKRPKSHFTD